MIAAGSTPESVFDTFPWPQFEMGSAPAPGAADRALEVGTGARPLKATSVSPQSSVPPRGCREGAATDTRGACAPQTIAKIDAVAAAAREVRRVRAEALQNLKGGLRALYRTLELPGANPLKDAHAALDAYGFSAKKDLLVQLLSLNLEVAAKIEKGEWVTSPGVPQNYPDAKTLITEDCITPPSPSGYPPYEPPSPKPIQKPIPGQSEADAAHFDAAKEEPPPYCTNSE